MSIPQRSPKELARMSGIPEKKRRSPSVKIGRAKPNHVRIQEDKQQESTVVNVRPIAYRLPWFATQASCANRDLVRALADLIETRYFTFRSSPEPEAGSVEERLWGSVRAVLEGRNTQDVPEPSESESERMWAIWNLGRFFREAEPRCRVVSLSVHGLKDTLSDVADSKQTDSSQVKSEFIQEHEGQALCWVEIAPGLRVRAYLPLEAIRKLELTSGDEFLWDLEAQAATAISTDPSEEEEWEQIGEELKELNREFHEELEPLIPDIEDE